MPRTPAPRAPAPRAAGCLLAFAVIAGAVIGARAGQPSAGLVAGFGAGALIATLLWLVERRQR